MIILRMLMGNGWSRETTTMWNRSSEHLSIETKTPFCCGSQSTEITATKEMIGVQEAGYVV